MERQVILYKALEVYGIDHQIMVMIEEMAELTKAFCKLYRGDGSCDDIREEMADVKIMLEQMSMFYGETDFIEEQKLERLRQRLEGQQAESRVEP